MKIGTKVLDWRLEIRLLGPSGPNIIYRPQTPNPRYFSRFHNFIWVILWYILEKMRSFLWKLLGLGLTTGGLISPLPKALGPNCPKLVFRLETPNARVLGSENVLCQAPQHFASNKLLFSNFGSFDKVTSAYSKKIAKKTLHKYSFWCHFKYVICKSCVKKTRFLEH